MYGTKIFPSIFMQKFCLFLLPCTLFYVALVSFLCNEKFTAMYRIFSSYWPFRSYAGFFSVNRPVYFYHHIQVFVLHTFLSSEIIWYKDGNFSFSVRICKFTEFVPRFFCRNISCAAVFQWVERGIPIRDVVHIFESW